jgi:alcohol dehydrogenase class IV
LDRYTHIARFLIRDEHASATDGINWARSLRLELNIPGLSRYGVREEHFPEIIGKAQQASSMKGNPIELTFEELSEILKSALT